MSINSMTSISSYMPGIGLSRYRDVANNVLGANEGTLTHELTRCVAFFRSTESTSSPDENWVYAQEAVIRYAQANRFGREDSFEDDLAQHLASFVRESQEKSNSTTENSHRSKGLNALARRVLNSEKLRREAHSGKRYS